MNRTIFLCAIFALLGSISTAHSGDDVWTWRAPKPQRNMIINAAYDSTAFCAVVAHDTLLAVGSFGQIVARIQRSLPLTVWQNPATATDDIAEVHRNAPIPRFSSD